MASKSALEQIFDKHPHEIGQLQNKSLIWFQAQVQALAGVSTKRPESLMRGDQGMKSSKIIPGNMYMYIYDPKYKDILPYYDIFPLVFPFHEVTGGFYGINLHYLPYAMRGMLLGNLMQLKTSSIYDERTKLKLSWGLLQKISKFHLVEPCVKHYLYDHVRTPFKRISSEDWATAMLLPAEHFQKANKLQVWADSIKRIR